MTITEYENRGGLVPCTNDDRERSKADTKYLSLCLLILRYPASSIRFGSVLEAKYIKIVKRWEWRVFLLQIFIVLLLFSMHACIWMRVVGRKKGRGKLVFIYCIVLGNEGWIKWIEERDSKWKWSFYFTALCEVEVLSEVLSILRRAGDHPRFGYSD